MHTLVLYNNHDKYIQSPYRTSNSEFTKTAIATLLLLTT